MLKLHSEFGKVGFLNPLGFVVFFLLHYLLMYVDSPSLLSYLEKVRKQIIMLGN